MDPRNELNYNVNLFDDCLKNAVKKFITKKTYTEKFKCSWFNDEIRRIKREKITKYEIARYENTNEAWSQYKNIRNIYKVKIQNEKRKYINNKIIFAKDQKEMWREIKNLILKKYMSTIEAVIFDTIEYKNNLEIAENFNKYFISSVEEIRSDITNVQYTDNIPVINSIFKFRAITLEELKTVKILR